MRVDGWRSEMYDKGDVPGRARVSEGGRGASGLRRVRGRADRWFLVLALPALAASVVRAADPDNCLLCHRFRGLSRYDVSSGAVRLFFVDPDYIHELRGPHARLACTDCHPRPEVAVIPHREVSRVDCTRECHLTEPGAAERRFNHANVAAMLERSTHPRELLAELHFAGGPLLRPDQSVCLYCHDEPVFRSPTGAFPSLRVSGERTFDRCNVCHAEQISIDIAYYLRHIAARLQPARPPLEQAQVCAVCHTDPRVLAEHHIKDAVASFVRSFHGKAALLGDQSTADCLSCHVAAGANAHLMLPPGDIHSSVNPQNLANACGSPECHPGADVRIAAASVHLDLPTKQAALEFGVAVAFIVLTVVSFCPSLLLCLLEMFQIVIGRRRHGEHAAELLTRAVLAHPEGRARLTRFTVSQRCQHWVLAVLFIVLAATGFPMKFADHTWSRAVIETLGGLHVARTIHHWAGIALVTGFLGHLAYCAVPLFRTAAERTAAGHRLGLFRALWRLPMFIQPSDLGKGYRLLLYLVGLNREPPTFGRFSIKEKFEYIGVFWGTILLGVTGVLLWGEQFFTHYVSGRVLNVALIAHTYEAFLAIIHVGILHIVNVIFAPNVFPLSPATITGTTPLRELAETHGEYVQQAARDLGISAAANGTHG
jgi:cytochrome b subunit of formate dehydrogenase